MEIGRNANLEKYKVEKNANFEGLKFGIMETWRMETWENGNLEKFNTGKMKIWIIEIKKLCTIKGNIKSKEIWINKNRE